MSPRGYRPRDTPDTVLSTLLRDHLDDFLERVNTANDGGLPVFVERQLRAMIDCGDPSQGFARLECGTCRAPRVVPFSCSGRLCPSCAGRRMNEQAAHLVDRVLPRQVPYRQWVLTLPWQLAQALAFDAGLSGRVFGLWAHELMRWQRARAQMAGLTAPHTGCVMEVQRFADGARLWPHAHLIMPDGVFCKVADGRVRFHGTGPPRDHDVEAIVTRVSEQVGRLLQRRARRAASGDGDTPDGPRQRLAQCAAVAPCGKVVLEGSANSDAMRRRAKARRRKPLCVRTDDGLELHASVRVKASDRIGLERVVKYMSRPPICDDRLTRLPDDRIEVRLKRPRGGTRALLFEPHAFIARLAALIPLPGANMRRFYGVFSAAHRYRTRVAPRPPCPLESGRPVAPKRPAKMGWADLLARTWGLDSLRCPYCQGRLRFIAAIHQPSAIEAILAAINVAEGEAAEARRREIRERAPPSPVQAPA